MVYAGLLLNTRTSNPEITILAAPPYREKIDINFEKLHIEVYDGGFGLKKHN